jgi:undecaprenyl-diphosphatase
LTFLGSILLGALQGITEFLPISSSAHLIILPWFFKMEDGNINKLTYDVMLHFGTLLAILLIYGKQFVSICIEGLTDIWHRNFRQSVLLKIVVATIPAAVFGLLLKDVIENSLRTPYVTIFTLIGVSILMLVSERIHVENRELSYPIALLIGIAQAIALVPGTSRSGITIIAGILLGLRRNAAVDFSFLLAIPIILGTSLYEGRHIQFQGGVIDLYLAGVISAFIFGTLSLKFLITYLKKHSFDIFAYYRFCLAALLLLYAYY